MPLKSTAVENDGAEPSVDLLNSNVAEAPKSSIGVRKIQPKKSGLGSKKVLGATKVKTNFADIEERANMANQLKEPVIEKKMTEEEEAEAMTSVRLAYQDLSLKKQKEEERLKNLDPNKAKQIERLGMAFNIKGGVSHSMMSDMKTLDQDQAPMSMKSSSSKMYERETSSSKNNDIFDDYSAFGSTSSSSSNKNDFRDAMMMGFEPIEPSGQVYSMFAAKEQPSKSTSVDRQPTSNYSRNSAKDSKMSSSNSYDTDSIQKKFAGAKAISSDQFFGGESSQAKSSNLSKFQDSTSISSSDYFGDGQQAHQSEL
jgi:ADP-ribosylation factor GTPase-activating protein 2/3